MADLADWRIEKCYAASLLPHHLVSFLIGSREGRRCMKPMVKVLSQTTNLDTFSAA